ncbi:DUF3310 domain-containing protein [Bifidobacterium platyrrhinorum]|uniref:DUF3310 domain-containing protein n=1 Tax=Bifidobacterium platyrrhinorum TaxID=2661628 RepID=A0A6L9SS79_9BIFI|nr:DUF3310 domain-containing protein [Bifidobacterium platyrrhinorum]NEG55426.1 DUF3310 domain-containing protein [Bifidobacterium platyrrhinorum]
MTDNINHPEHYESGPYECILLTEKCSFNVGNMIKYVWRHRLKNHPVEDLQKALWYARRAKEDSEAFGPCRRAFRYTSNMDTGTFEWPGTDFKTLLNIKKNFCQTPAEKQFYDALMTENSDKAIEALETLIKEAEQ